MAVSVTPVSQLTPTQILQYDLDKEGDTDRLIAIVCRRILLCHINDEEPAIHPRVYTLLRDPNTRIEFAAYFTLCDHRKGYNPYTKTFVHPDDGEALRDKLQTMHLDIASLLYRDVPALEITCAMLRSFKRSDQRAYSTVFGQMTYVLCLAKAGQIKEILLDRNLSCEEIFAKVKELFTNEEIKMVVSHGKAIKLACLRDDHGVEP